MLQQYLTLFGQRPRRGRCPVEHRGTFVRSSVRACVRACVRASPPAWRLKSWPRGSNPGYSSRFFCRLLFLCLFKRSIALGLGVGLRLGIGLGFVLGLGLGVGLALGLGWVRFYMLQSKSACIKGSLWRRIPKKTKDVQNFLNISLPS